MLHRSSSTLPTFRRWWFIVILVCMVIFAIYTYERGRVHLMLTSSSRSSSSSSSWSSSSPSLPRTSELVFLGTGTSAGTPRPKCVIDPDSECEVCRDAVTKGPSRSRNWRGNPSLLIRYRQGKTVRNIQIDVGKTFYTSMLYTAPKIGLWPMRLDAVVLTHAHADAVFGLDELRDFPSPSAPSTSSSSVISSSKKKSKDNSDDKGIPVWATTITRDSLKSTAPYLFPGGSRLDGGIARRVSQLDWRVMTPLQPFEVVTGLWITPIAMYHGGDYQAMGFVIGGSGGSRDDDDNDDDNDKDDRKNTNNDNNEKKKKPKKNKKSNNNNDDSSNDNKPPRIVYISDVSEVPEDSLTFLQDSPIDILILEAFSWTRRISSHINLEQAITLIRQLAPARTYITGISHDMEHERLRKHLAAYRDTDHLWIEPAYDGLRVPCDL